MTYHSMNADELRNGPYSRERASALLSRYPSVSADEAREIFLFLRNGRHLDVGLLTSSDRLRPKLDAFMADHRAEFRLKWSEGVLIVGGIVALLIICWLVWESLAS